jgi:ubiquinone biosynthesis protein Coq4
MVYGIDKAPSPFGAMASHVKVSDPRSAQKIRVCLNLGIQMGQASKWQMKWEEKWEK